MSMEEKVVAYAHLYWTGQGVIANPAYNCTVADAGAGVGDLNLTIGEGGVDRTLCQIVAVPSTQSSASATVTHTSDTVKRIQFRGDDGVLYTPDGAYIEIKRLPPLATPT